MVCCHLLTLLLHSSLCFLSCQMGGSYSPPLELLWESLSKSVESLMWGRGLIHKGTIFLWVVRYRQQWQC